MERTLHLNGTIAEESWFDDDVTPQLFADELNACYANLRNGVLSVENIWAEFEAFAETVPADMLAWDNAYYNAEGEKIRTFELMDSLIQEYLPRVDAEFGYETEESYGRP